MLGWPGVANCAFGGMPGIRALGKPRVTGDSSGVEANAGKSVELHGSSWRSAGRRTRRWAWASVSAEFPCNWRRAEQWTSLASTGQEEHTSVVGSNLVQVAEQQHQRLICPFTTYERGRCITDACAVRADSWRLERHSKEGENSENSNNFPDVMQLTTGGGLLEGIVEARRSEPGAALQPSYIFFSGNFYC